MQWKQALTVKLSGCTWTGFCQILRHFWIVLGTAGMNLRMSLTLSCIIRLMYAGTRGGALTWIVYLIVQPYFDDYFIPYLIASLFVGIFAEIMARVNRAPATIFLTTAAVPLIPGGSLYYTMLGIVEKDQELMETSANNTITIALAIAMGFIIIAIVGKYWFYFKNHKNAENEK